jgi:hypothetical protein
VRCSFTTIIIAGAIGCWPINVRARDAPLDSPARLNIGLMCQWNSGCMRRQERAMERGLRYVRKSRPSDSNLRLCDRNSARGGGRVDWIGFNNCIRNSAIRPARQRAAKSAKPPPSPSYASMVERG